MTITAGRKSVDTHTSDSSEGSVPGRHGGDAVRSVLFFAFSYLYVWLWVEPCLIYSCGTITNFPVFYRGWPFFLERVSCPGGLIKYVSAFVSQFLEYSWAGAAVITIQAWAISACTGYLLRVVRVPGARLLRFVPAIFVLIAYCRYSYHLPLFMGALASLAFGCLYVRLTCRRNALAQPCGLRDGVVYLLLSVILYVVGAAAFLPFAGLCIACELCRKRWRCVGFYLPVAAALPYVAGVLGFRISLVNAYTEMLPISWRVLGWTTREKMVAAVYVVYLFPLVGVLAGGLGHILSARLRRREAGEEPPEKPPKGRRAGPDKSRRGSPVRWITKPAVQWAFGTVVLFAAGGTAVVSSLDGRQKALLAVHHYACRRMWLQVLTAARHCPSSLDAINAINRALYYTGRLDRDMFLYAQQPDGLLRTGDDHVVLYWHVFDTLIDLGLVNLAEKNLTECLETFGEHPLILERLAKVNLVKGRADAARIYLGRLEKTLFHRRGASECLAHLDADPNLSGDAEIQRLRVQRLRKDSPALFYAEEALLTALVEQGGGIGPQPPNSVSPPPNRMAFKYLMAWHLLKGQLGRIVQQIERLDEFGYTEIPPLCQEAILIYAYGTGKPVDLHGRSISPEMDRRMKHFSSVVNRHGNDRAAAVAELARDYRGSYFFYYFCTRVANR